MVEMIADFRLPLRHCYRVSGSHMTSTSRALLPCFLKEPLSTQYDHKGPYSLLWEGQRSREKVKSRTDPYCVRDITLIHFLV